jgi:hypothetical protein
LIDSRRRKCRETPACEKFFNTGYRPFPTRRAKKFECHPKIFRVTLARTTECARANYPCFLGIILQSPAARACEMTHEKIFAHDARLDRRARRRM